MIELLLVTLLALAFDGWQQSTMERICYDSSGRIRMYFLQLYYFIDAIDTALSDLTHNSFSQTRRNRL